MKKILVAAVFPFLWAALVQAHEEPPSGFFIDDRHSHSQSHHEEAADHHDWRFAGQLVSKGASKADELPARGPVHRVKFRCVSGSSAIHTLVVREGSAKKHIPVTTRVSSGQEFVKDLSREYQATGFRISHEGNGVIEVYAQ